MHVFFLSSHMLPDGIAVSRYSHTGALVSHCWPLAQVTPAQQLISGVQVPSVHLLQEPQSLSVLQDREFFLHSPLTQTSSAA
jgi:hypothetical protein